MSSEEAVPVTSAVPPGGLRARWFPIAVLVFGAVVLTVAWSLPAESYSRGMQQSLTFVVVALMLLLTAGWFFLFAGTRGKTRLIVLSGLIVLAALGTTLIRNVEFSGDMRPTVRFRWQEDPQVRLATHLAGQSAAPTDRPATFFQFQPGDVAEYRGQQRDGVVRGATLAREWSPAGLAPLWRQPVGGGYASLSNSGQALVTIEQRQDREAVVCYDRQSGQQVWVYDYPALFSEKLGGDGPRATPTVADARVYSLGATGWLACLDLATGKELWKVNILSLNGVRNVEWGMCGSPLVSDGLVVVNPGSQKGNDQSHAVLAFAAEDGKLRWSAGEGQASYASPLLVELGGTRQVVVFDAIGLAGFAVADGTPLWRFPWKSDFDINAAQPLVLENDRVLISSATGTALLEIKQEASAWNVREVWRERSLKSSYANPVVHAGYVYGLDEGILVCLDLESGKRRWKKGRHGHGQLLLCEDLLVVLSETGRLVLVEATPEAYRELGNFQALEGKTWNNPIVVDGKAYVRNHLEMACYDLAAPSASPAAAP